MDGENGGIQTRYIKFGFDASRNGNDLYKSSKQLIIFLS